MYIHLLSWFLYLAAFLTLPQSSRTQLKIERHQLKITAAIQLNLGDKEKNFYAPVVWIQKSQQFSDEDVTKNGMRRLKYRNDSWKKAQGEVKMYLYYSIQYRLVQWDGLNTVSLRSPPIT